MRPKLLLIACSLAAFGAALLAAFQFDDFALFSDPAITAPSGWLDCFRLTQTRPLTWLSFWLNFQLGGANPIGYHAFNLALHLAVVLLLYSVLQEMVLQEMVLRRLLSQRIQSQQTAFFAALIFAVHPALTEAVTYVFARSILIATLFCLLAIRDWLRQKPWRSVLWFTLAMLGKEECVALPLVLLLLDRATSHRASPQPVASTQAPTSQATPTHRTPMLALFAVALLLGIRVLWATLTVAGSGAGTQAGISPLEYFSSQGLVILTYLWRILVPWGFSVDYGILPASPIFAPLWFVPWLPLAFSRVRRSPIGLFYLAGLILLLPSSSILPANDLMADRRMYLPMLAFAPALALALQHLAQHLIKIQRPQRQRAFASALMLLPLLLWIGISIRYTLLWRSGESLWGEASRLAPTKLRPRLQLARSVSPDRALPILREAEQLAPMDPAIATQQGTAWLQLNRPAEALTAYGRALALTPEDPAAMNNRGVALLALGQQDAARADFERALARNPCLFDPRVNLSRMNVATQAPATCRFTPEQHQALGLRR